jgi:hypothetical protein
MCSFHQSSFFKPRTCCGIGLWWWCGISYFRQAVFTIGMSASLPLIP